MKLFVDTRDNPKALWGGIALIAFVLLVLPFALASIGTAWCGGIIRIFLNNLYQPINITNGPQGIVTIDPFRIGAFDLAKADTILGLAFSGPIKYYYLLLIVLLVVMIVNMRLQNSRIG